MRYAATMVEDEDRIIEVQAQGSADSRDGLTAWTTLKSHHPPLPEDRTSSAISQAVFFGELTTLEEPREGRDLP